jgi:hypothetical protein
MNILSYVESVPRVMATEALHYCLRALEHAGELKQSNRDIFFDVPSCAPGPESRALTLAVLSGIEEAEKKQLDDLDRVTIAAYTHDIASTVGILSSRIPGFNLTRGREMLEKIQAASRPAK